MAHDNNPLIMELTKQRFLPVGFERGIPLKGGTLTVPVETLTVPVETLTVPVETLTVPVETLTVPVELEAQRMLCADFKGQVGYFLKKYLAMVTKVFFCSLNLPVFPMLVQSFAIVLDSRDFK